MVDLLGAMGQSEMDFGMSAGVLAELSAEKFVVE